MLRRLALSVGAIALIAAIPAAQAIAAPRPHLKTAAHAKRVCAAPKVAGVAACDALVRTDASGRPLVHPDLPSGYGPAQFHTGYNLPTTSGSPQTIAIVDAYANPNVFNDLKVYDSTYGLPKFKKCKTKTQKSCLAVLNQNGKKKPLPVGNTGWGLEISLDVQTAHEICQNCRINLYEANSNSFGNLEAAVNTAAAQGADAISNSYSTGPGTDCSPIGAYNHAGIAITVSAGDSGFGSSCPGVLNTVVAVGGTNLQLNGSNHYVSESVWTGTGSGCSTSNSAPSWQTGESTWSAIACGSGRGQNDVSADADPATGAAVYDTYGYGGWLTVGGTSLSAPLIAGVYALAGNASSYTYPAQSVYLDSGADLHDVTTGSNGSCAHSLQCHGGTGFDLPTGVGTPNGLGAF